MYATLEENIATLYYQVPKSWNEETKIQAIYTGYEDIPECESEILNPKIATPEIDETPEIIIENTTADIGSEVNITVTTKNL